jgi:hypothetical protein
VWMLFLGSVFRPECRLARGAPDRMKICADPRALTSVGRIYRRRHVQIHKCLGAVRQTGRVALRIRRVPRALTGVFGFRRPRILPNQRLRNSAGGRPERLPRENAARRWRALVVDHPQCHVMIMAQNVERGADFARAIRDQYSVAINTRFVSRSSYRLDPGKQISALLRQESSALLLIEKHNRPWRKTLPFSARNRCRGVGTAECRRILAFKLGIQSPVVQDHEAKTVSLEGFALANPRIAVFARRIVQPVSGVGESTVQLRQELVSGVIVPVKAYGMGARLRQAKGCQAET